MKRIVSLLLACVLLVGSVLTLASCATFVMGTYTNDTLNTTYEFSFGKVTRTTEIFGLTVSKEGTYKIEKNPEDPEKYTITFTWGEASEDDGEDDDGVAFAFAQGTENGVKYVLISGLKYTQKAD